VTVSCAYSLPIMRRSHIHAPQNRKDVKDGCDEITLTRDDSPMEILTISFDI
jgi:hypothetical protein